MTYNLGQDFTFKNKKIFFINRSSTLIFRACLKRFLNNIQSSSDALQGVLDILLEDLCR